MSSCLGQTASGAACITAPVEGTDLCPIHTSADAKRAHMSELGRRSQEAARARRVKKAEQAPERVKLDTIEDCQDLLEKAAAMVLSGTVTRGMGADVARIVSMARVVLDIRALKRENAELRKLLAIKKSPIPRGE